MKLRFFAKGSTTTSREINLRTVLKAISVFSGGGIGDSGLAEIGVRVDSSLEIVPDRVRLSGHLNQETHSITGDIRDQKVRESLANGSAGTELLIMTPPCQGVSVAGKGRGIDNRLLDERNFLIFPALDLVNMIEPSNVILENVPQFLNLFLPHDGDLVSVPELLKQVLGNRYEMSFSVLDSADLGVPQTRRRAFIHLSRKSKPIDFGQIRLKRPAPTVREAIGALESLESGEASDIFWHFARRHSADHVNWMRHTETGKSAVDNKVHYPKKADGRRISAYNTAYRRMEWDEPAPTITMRNDAISSQKNVHPGRALKDGTFSDARVLSVHELVLLMGMDPGRFPRDKSEELSIRRSLGEGIPPKLLSSVVEMIG
jgi:DNA (cytosine-5)-methyltransferase 1